MNAALKGYLAAATVVVFWSGFNIVSRLGGRSVLTPYDLAALRFAVSALLLLPFLLRLRFAATLMQLAILSACGGLGYALLVYWGFSLAPAAHAGILVNGGIPFATVLVAWLALGVRPAARTLLALALAGLGIALISYESLVNEVPTSGPRWLGDLFFLAAATAFAIFGLLLKRWRIRPLEAVVGVAVIAASSYLPVYLLFLPKALSAAPASVLLLQGVYQGIIAAVLAGLLYTYANLTIGPMKASLMLALVPGISALAAVPLLGEELSMATLLGVALVTGGAVLGTSGQAPTRQAG